MMLSHSVGSDGSPLTVGAFFMNAAEMFVDVAKFGGDVPGMGSHWMAESGVLDVFLMPGPSPAAVFAQYARLTGGTDLPQLFALGYHQCRWNYRDEEDVAAVDAGFDEHGVPYDVLWLDIEHTDGKRYFTWDSKLFPSPAEMQADLASRGRKMVTIVDPHVKRDTGYHIHTEAMRKGYYVKKADGSDFEGWCWPGSSSYLDVTSPTVREWFGAQFSLSNYAGSTKTLYIWNDMNEPSVFNGPEITMHKDLVHAGGVEHRDIHNMFGSYYFMTTAEGLKKRSPGERPFVLSRAFFAGSQRYGAIWTGDNSADWDHFRVSIPMVLTLGLTGMTFSGADIGGFFGDPEPELLVRWYQLGQFYPFFRGHAHHETKRREPWLLGGEHAEHIKAAIRGRYANLPYIYTLFADANAVGSPVLRPTWVEFPSDPTTFDQQEAFMLGPALLVLPVLSKGQTSVSAQLPGGAAVKWYDFASGAAHECGEQVQMVAGLGDIPSLIRGGSIIPRRERARRSTVAMLLDPYTLIVAADADGIAAGELYVDDGSTYAWRDRGAFLRRRFTLAGGALSCTDAGSGADAASVAEGQSLVERIVILGLKKPAQVTLSPAQGEPRALTFGAGPVTLAQGATHPSAALVIRLPNVAIGADWTISLS